jgi:uncharacterized protein (TIGR02246 family)
MLSPDDRRAIEQVHGAWLDAELRGDASALLDLCASSPVWLPPGAPPVVGRTAIREWLASQPAAEIRRIDIRNLTIAGSGVLAVKTAGFVTTVAAIGGDAQVFHGSHVWVLRRDEAGVWRVAVVAWLVD